MASRTRLLQHSDSEAAGPKGPCPHCQNDKSYQLYNDGHGYCFKCKARDHAPTSSSDAGSPSSPANATDEGRASPEFLEGHIASLPKRSLSAATCKRWGYLQTSDAHIACYRDSGGALVGQKVRYDGKRFEWRGARKGVPLFGQHLHSSGGKRIAVVEGELDALSLHQALDHKYPVVSVPFGAKGAVGSLRENLKYLLTFEEVILGFDNDPEGQAATEECVALFEPGRVKVMKYGDLKDASDYLQASRTGDLTKVFWNAEPWRPDGVVSVASLAASLRDKPTVGLPWHSAELTKLTYGRRPGELYGFGAGTGVGKSDLFAQEIAHTAHVLREPCGGLFFEQMPTETARRIAGKLVERRLHVPDAGWTDADLVTAERLLRDLPVHLYDHFGSTEWDVVEKRMRYMVLGLGCRHLFLDHLTALVADADDETKALNSIMEKLSSFAQETKCCLYFISHLATPLGTPHEEGGRVMLRHFRGSRAIGFWTHFAFGLERNQQHPDVDARMITTLRVLKDRYTGQANGSCVYLKYDPPTGLLKAHSGPPPEITQAGGERYGFGRPAPINPDQPSEF